ncbi:MAG: hypothetical protein IIA91_05180 [Chloroflexi bacterium]|nr:hypothetical protein [Chloroflexota bacterium]
MTPLVEVLLFIFAIAPLFLGPAGVWMLHRLYRFQGEITLGARIWLIVVAVGASLAVGGTIVDFLFVSNDEAERIVAAITILGLVIVMLPVLLSYLIPERNSNH